MHLTVPHGVPPTLDPGETWDPATDRVTTWGGHGSYQVRRPGMCSLCPAPGRLLQLTCEQGLHTWDQLLCAKHEAGCHPGGDVRCLGCVAAHVDVRVVA